MKPVFLFFALIVLAAFMFAVSDGPERSDTLDAAIEADADAVMEGVGITSSRGGEVLWKLRTDRAVLTSGSSIAKLGEVMLELPSDELFVHAGSGVYNSSDDMLSLGTGVRADTGQMVIFADYATLDPKTGEVVTDSEVRVNGRGFKVKGHGFRARGSRIRILESVEAEVE